MTCYLSASEAHTLNVKMHFLHKARNHSITPSPFVSNFSPASNYIEIIEVLTKVKRYREINHYWQIISCAILEFTFSCNRWRLFPAIKMCFSDRDHCGWHCPSNCLPCSSAISLPWATLTGFAYISLLLQRTAFPHIHYCCRRNVQLQKVMLDPTCWSTGCFTWR